MASRSLWSDALESSSKTNKIRSDAKLTNNSSIHDSKNNGPVNGPSASTHTNASTAHLTSQYQQQYRQREKVLTEVRQQPHFRPSPVENALKATKPTALNSSDTNRSITMDRQPYSPQFTAFHTTTTNSCHHARTASDSAQIQQRTLLPARNVTRRDHQSSGSSSSSSSCLSPSRNLAVSNLPLRPQRRRQRKASKKLETSLHVLEEILVTERLFVNDMEKIVSGYLNVMRREHRLDSEHLAIIFGNIEEIVSLHKALLTRIEQNSCSATHVAKCFCQASKQFFSAYVTYCSNYPKSMELLGRLNSVVDYPEFRAWLDRVKTLNQQSLPLAAFLLKPVQRIMKYHLLFDKINDTFIAAGCEGFFVKKALTQLKALAQHINEVKTQHDAVVRKLELAHLVVDIEANNNDGVEFNAFGNLVVEDDLLLHGVRGKRHVILFENVLLVTKKRQSDGALVCKGCVQCTNMLLVEIVPDQPLAFHVIPYDTPKQQYTLICRDDQQKRRWIREIKRRILENYQLKIPEKAKRLFMSDNTKLCIPDDLGSTRRIEVLQLRPHESQLHNFAVDADNGRLQGHSLASLYVGSGTAASVASVASATPPEEIIEQIVHKPKSGARKFLSSLRRGSLDPDLLTSQALSLSENQKSLKDVGNSPRSRSTKTESSKKPALYARSASTDYEASTTAALGRRGRLPSRKTGIAALSVLFNQQQQAFTASETDLTERKQSEIFNSLVENNIVVTHERVNSNTTARPTIDVERETVIVAKRHLSSNSNNAVFLPHLLITTPLTPEPPLSAMSLTSSNLPSPSPVSPVPQLRSPRTPHFFSFDDGSERARRLSVMMEHGVTIGATVSSSVYSNLAREQQVITAAVVRSHRKVSTAIPHSPVPPKPSSPVNRLLADIPRTTILNDGAQRRLPDLNGRENVRSNHNMASAPQRNFVSSDISPAPDNFGVSPLALYSSPANSSPVFDRNIALNVRRRHSDFNQPTLSLGDRHPSELFTTDLDEIDVVGTPATTANLSNDGQKRTTGGQPLSTKQSSLTKKPLPPPRLFRRPTQEISVASVRQLLQQEQQPATERLTTYSVTQPPSNTAASFAREERQSTELNISSSPTVVKSFQQRCIDPVETPGASSEDAAVIRRFRQQFLNRKRPSAPAIKTLGKKYDNGTDDEAEQAAPSPAATTTRNKLLNRFSKSLRRLSTEANELMQQLPSRSAVVAAARRSSSSSRRSVRNEPAVTCNPNGSHSPATSSRNMMTLSLAPDADDLSNGKPAPNSCNNSKRNHEKTHKRSSSGNAASVRRMLGKPFTVMPVSLKGLRQQHQQQRELARQQKFDREQQGKCFHWLHVPRDAKDFQPDEEFVGRRGTGEGTDNEMQDDDCQRPGRSRRAQSQRERGESGIVIESDSDDTVVMKNRRANGDDGPWQSVPVVEIPTMHISRSQQPKIMHLKMANYENVLASVYPPLVSGRGTSSVQSGTSASINQIQQSNRTRF